MQHHSVVDHSETESVPIREFARSNRDAESISAIRFRFADGCTFSFYNLQNTSEREERTERAIQERLVAAVDRNDNRRIEIFPTHINDPEFAHALVAEFMKVHYSCVLQLCI